MSAIPFTCGCGTPVPTLRAWRRWQLVGHQSLPADDEEPEDFHLEYRNCPRCKSTKAIEVDEATVTKHAKRAKRDPNERQERARTAIAFAERAEKKLEHFLSANERSDPNIEESAWYRTFAELTHEASDAWLIAADATEEAADSARARYMRMAGVNLAELAKHRIGIARRLEQLEARPPYTAKKRKRLAATGTPKKNR